MRLYVSTVLLLVLLCSGVNAHAGGEYSNLSLQKTVDRHQPLPGEPVEFTIEVLNHGDYLAPDLHVQDKLPPQFLIPEGRGAFTDKGYYDPDTGDWDVGELDVGESAVLVLPVLLQGDELPECVVNTTELDHPQDSTSYNNRSSMAVRGASGRNCADVESGFSLTPGKSPGFLLKASECDAMWPYDGTVRLKNRGPQVARNVEVSLSQEPLIGPNLRFDDSDCVSGAGGVCRVSEMAVGAELRLDFVSDAFVSKTKREQRFSVTVVTGSNDYDDANNNPALDITVSAFSLCDSGVIPGVPEPTLPGVGDGGGGSGCFIATAAYGSYLHPRVEVLRQFRDEVLLTSAAGRRFVDLYYEYSPPLANLIADRDWLRGIVRVLLLPLVLFISHPFLVSGITLLLCTGIVLRTKLNLPPSL